MEFLQILLLLVTMVILIKKPEKEKLAFGILLISWLFMIYFYIGHKSAALLGNMNL